MAVDYDLSVTARKHPFNERSYKVNCLPLVLNELFRVLIVPAIVCLYGYKGVCGTCDFICYVNNKMTLFLAWGTPYTDVIPTSQPLSVGTQLIFSSLKSSGIGKYSAIVRKCSCDCCCFLFKFIPPQFVWAGEV